jgi:hypothetical protein
MSEEQLKASSAPDTEDVTLQQQGSGEELTDEELENAIGGSDAIRLQFSSEEFGTDYRYIITNLDGSRRSQ